jgi:hypothetical protein
MDPNAAAAPPQMAGSPSPAPMAGAAPQTPPQPPQAGPAPAGAPPAPSPDPSTAPDPTAALQAQINALQTQITWDDVKGLLSQPGNRQFRVDIETDSTVSGDIQSEQQGMAELLQGISQFLTAFGPAVQQGFMTAESVKAMLLAAVRRMRMGKTVEDAIDQIPDNPQPAAPAGKGGDDDDAQEAAMQAANDQRDMERQKMIEATKQQQLATDADLRQRQMEIDAENNRADAANKAEELKLKARQLDIDQARAASDHEHRLWQRSQPVMPAMGPQQ